jgi:hypothetical protein
MMLPPNVDLRVSICDMPRSPGMVIYEIIGDTPIRVQREIDRIMRQVESAGGMAMFRNPMPFGGAWISRGYVIEPTKEPLQ